MKRVFLFITIFALAAGVLTGCRSKDSSSATTETPTTETKATTNDMLPGPEDTIDETNGANQPDDTIEESTFVVEPEESTDSTQETRSRVRPRGNILPHK